MGNKFPRRDSRFNKSQVIYIRSQHTINILKPPAFCANRVSKHMQKQRGRCGTRDLAYGWLHPWRNTSRNAKASSTTLPNMFRDSLGVFMRCFLKPCDTLRQPNGLSLRLDGPGKMGMYSQEFTGGFFLHAIEAAKILGMLTRLKALTNSRRSTSRTQSQGTLSSFHRRGSKLQCLERSEVPPLSD